MSERSAPLATGIGARSTAIERRWLSTDRILLVAVLGVLVWFTADVLLLVFAGLLIAVGLDGSARIVAEQTPLGRGVALTLVVVLLLAALALLGYLIVPQFLGQVGALWETIVAAFGWLEERLQAAGWMQPLEMLNNEEGQGQIADAAAAIAGHLATATTGALGAIAGLVVLLAIALFAAADPRLYRGGFLALFPTPRRQRIDETLGAVAHGLRWWFLGQIVSMLILGVSVAVGLLVIGVELWLSLGVLTALLTFIPVLGPIIAGVPIVIVGFAEGAQTGLIVLAFYLVVQNVEGNFVVPLIHQKAVHLAPALMIASQVLMGTLFGLVGFILAAPITVAAMIAVRELYIEDVVEQHGADGA
jgi:predicted PurR-regulated permease PerM